MAVSDGAATSNDFPARSHCIARWYGVREFIVITPAGQTDAINSEDKCKLLISSAAVALNNTQRYITLLIVHRVSAQFADVSVSTAMCLFSFNLTNVSGDNLAASVQAVELFATMT